MFYRIGVGGVGFGRFQAGLGRVARIDDGFEGFAFVFHVSLNGFDEIRDQVVAARQLHVDLCERVTNPVALVDQPVVDADRPEHYRGDEPEEDQK